MASFLALKVERPLRWSKPLSRATRWAPSFAEQVAQRAYPDDLGDGQC